MQLLGYDINTLVLVMATVLGSYGGFPAPPAPLASLMQNQLVQWALVFVLAYQGGAGQDIKLAALGTAMLYALHMFLSN